MAEHDVDDEGTARWKGLAFIAALILVPLAWIAIQGALHLNYVIPYK